MFRALMTAEDLAQKVIGTAIVLLLASMIAIGGLQVFSRSVVNFSLAWSDEFQRYCQAWLVFLTVPYVYAKGGHIAMELFTEQLPAGLRGAIGAAVDATWAALGVLLIVTGSRIVSLGLAQRSASLGVSMGLVYSVVVISGIYIAILAARRLAQRLLVGQERSR